MLFPLPWRVRWILGCHSGAIHCSLVRINVFPRISLYRKDRSLASGWFLIRQRRSEFLIIRKEFRLVREITNQESRSQTRLTTNGPAFTSYGPASTNEHEFSRDREDHELH